jgi:hypothetical protein
MVVADTMCLPRFDLLRDPDSKICSVRGHVSE